MVEYQSRETPGPELLFTGTWSGSTRYRPGHVVIHSGTAYVCLRTHSNVTPGTDSTAWSGISVGATGPTGPAGTSGQSTFPVHPTASAPDPIAAGAGSTYYDSDLSVPFWSDGVIWRYSNGNPAGE
jgi:hypothetical protein